jgi:pullulanase/glycogen debranching enzyme
MQETDAVGSFSDDYRNMMKSGFGAETDPRFLTDGQVSIERIIDNIKAQPQNFEADDPGDVVNYIESHDNMTVHDVIALATESDPDFKEAEIQKRLRLGNLMLLTSQGIIFLHSGQEYGKTKQFRTETKTAPPSSFVGVNGAGRDFKYPYFIDDSYNATDAVNMFEWEKVNNSKVHKCTVDYTRGLIKLHRLTDAFRLGDLEEIEARVTEVKSKNIAAEDLAAAYKIEALKASYYIFVNADQKRREFKIEKDLTEADVLVDAEQAGTEALNSPKGVEVDPSRVVLDCLTGTVIRCAE